MTLPTGTHNYAGMAFRANLEKNPDLMTFDVEKHEATQKKRREAEAKANPPKVTPLQVELNKLRGELFNLQQNAKGTEQRVNNEAGNIKLLEQRINTAIKEKKGYIADGNLRGERTVEKQIESLEGELADTRERLVKEQHYNTAAVRELRTWQTENGPRLKELQQQVASIPTQK
jgi:predicted  nucleic acid-binding Zn-ribbon protein